MTTQEAEGLSFLVVVWVPLLVVWIVVLVDLVRQPRMARSTKLAWAAACTVVWPAMILYWMTRPTQGRAERDEGRTDAHHRLVQAALAHEDGRLDDAALAQQVRQLRQTGPGR